MQDGLKGRHFQLCWDSKAFACKGVGPSNLARTFKACLQSDVPSCSLGIARGFLQPLCHSTFENKKTRLSPAELETLLQSPNTQHGKPREADELHPVYRALLSLLRPHLKTLSAEISWIAIFVSFPLKCCSGCSGRNQLWCEDLSSKSAA